MIIRSIRCDVCGAEILTSGGQVVLDAHEAAKVILPTFPPKSPGTLDLCRECRDELSDWLTERKRAHAEEVGEWRGR